MTSVVTISFPLFAIILLGFVAFRRGLIHEQAPAVLIGLIYYFLLPPFLIMKIVDSNFRQGVDLRVIAPYYTAVAVVFFIAYVTSRLLYPGDPKAIGIRSIASIAANTGYLGLPIVTMAFGDRAAIPGVAMVFCDNLIVLVGGTLLLEAAGSKDIRWQKVLVDTFGKIARNPLILSIALGTAYVLLVASVPKPIRILGRLLADATLPCALFALGATLAGRQVGPSSVDRFYVVALKLVAHPLFTFLFARYLFRLSRADVAIVVLMAAMPVSVNTFIVASRYKAQDKEISSILFVTTCLSLVITTGLLITFSS